MMRNAIQFHVWGRDALFTDPVTKIGGEKCSYQIPTYESLKGITESIYWKPTFVWIIDRVRIINRIRTQSRGMKPRKYHSVKNELSIYTYLADVSYQVEAHFEWNEHRRELTGDRNENKHHQVARRMLDRGGRRDIFLGTRECQGYVEPCDFGSGAGHYDTLGELSYGVMFHGFDYPGESGQERLTSRFWRPVMQNGVIDFVRPEHCPMSRLVRTMRCKTFAPGENFAGLQEEGLLT